MHYLYNGDCLEESHNITAGSVDLILTDPPFGTMKGHSDVGGKYKEGRMDWDTVIDPAEFFEMADRLLRPNGRLVIFGQEPFTSQVVTEQIPAVPFTYRMIWKKSSAGNHLTAKTAPANYFEDIMVFKKIRPAHDFEEAHPLRMYFQYIHAVSGRTKKSLAEELGGRVDHPLRYNSSQFSAPTQETYEALVNVCGVVDAMPFEDMAKIDEKFKAGLFTERADEFPSVFNLPEGKGSRSNVLEYKKDAEKLHPTQKPVALLSEIIETFTHAGDVVADLTMGSGSTGAAAIRTGRHFFGVEMDPTFFKVATDRLDRESNSFLNDHGETV